MNRAELRWPSLVECGDLDFCICIELQSGVQEKRCEMLHADKEKGKSTEVVIFSNLILFFYILAKLGGKATTNIKIYDTFALTGAE